MKIRFEKVKPQNEKVDSKIEQTEKEHSEHLKESEDARKAMKIDQSNASSDATKCTITFDLQKTLPTPKIPTGFAFYKRQLWVYSLGIHAYQNEDEKVYMFMWHEGIASRGAQEVASCLKDFVLTKLPSEIKHLTAWSESCGGLNRNIKVCTMWMNLIENSQLESIDDKFLESGHSYLPCDSNFGDIEKRARRFEHIFCPDEWYALVSDCRQTHPFNVVKMTTNNFVSTAGLEKTIVNRKKDENGDKVQWLKMKHTHFDRASPLKMFYKYSHTEGTFKAVDLAPKSKKAVKYHSFSEDQPLLNPNGRAITKEKKSDIKELFPYIPPCNHAFYRSLRTDRDIVDDICGNNIDYDLE